MNSAFYNRFIGVAGILGAIGVIVGAFGAHFLKERIDITHIATLNTGVLYLFIHTLGIMGVSLLGKKRSGFKTIKECCRIVFDRCGAFFRITILDCHSGSDSISCALYWIYYSPGRLVFYCWLGVPDDLWIFK